MLVHLVADYGPGDLAAAEVTQRLALHPAGELAFAPGSSGWPQRSGGERVWYELLLRGGNAALLLGDPAAGSRIEVSPPESG